MIKKLILTNFRGHNREINFGPGINLIKGRNEVGKSTIKEAIAFAWYGTDSEGIKSPDHLISVGSSVTEVTLVTDYVALTRKKKAGGTSQIKLESNGFPPVTLTQTELSERLKLSLEAFTACWNVGYFMSLTPAKQITVLAELAGLDRRKLLEEIVGYAPPASMKLSNLTTDANGVATQRRQIANAKASEEGALGQVQAQLRQLQASDDVDVESYQAHVNELNARLEEFAFYDKALGLYKSKLSTYEFQKDLKTKAEKDLKEAEDQLAALAPMTATEDIVGMREFTETLKTNINTLQASMQPAPLAPTKPEVKPGATCPTCLQFINDSHVESLTAAYEHQLLAYNKEARRIEDINADLRSQIKANQTLLTETQNDLADKHSRNVQTALSEERLEKEIQKLKRATLVEDLPIPVAPEKPRGDAEPLRKELLEFSTAVNIAKRQATQIAGLNAQIETIKAAIEEKNQKIAKYQKLERALQQLPQLETQRTLEAIDIPGVNIALEEGEIKFSDKNGVFYQSLSRGRKMKTSALISTKLRQVAGKRAPKWVFLDDADLMDEFVKYVPQETQVFVAQVDANQNELTVEQI